MKEQYYIHEINQHMHINKICLLYITIYQHVLVTSGTTTRVSYKNTNNIHTVAYTMSN